MGIMRSYSSMKLAKSTGLLYTDQMKRMAFVPGYRQQKSRMGTNEAGESFAKKQRAHP